jgi:hypothetical protein
MRQRVGANAISNVTAIISPPAFAVVLSFLKLLIQPRSASAAYRHTWVRLNERASAANCDRAPMFWVSAPL